MTTPAERNALFRLAIGWLNCTADLSAQPLPPDGVADIEVVLPGARVAYLDILPELRLPCEQRDARRERLRGLGVPFAPVASLLDMRFALEELGVLDRRGV